MGLLYLYLTSNNTGTVLSRNVAQLDAIIVPCISYIWNSILVLSTNGKFLGRATVAFCEQRVL